MKKLMLVLIMVSAVAGVTYYYNSKSDAPPAVTETAIPRIAVEKHTLANGLEVLLVEDHRLPRVAVNLWYHVGPVNEEPGRTGFAHLFEHMMFQKSKHIPEDSYFKFLETAGASDVNGTTDRDRTNYFETVPSNQLELALWLESDRMGFLLDDLTGPSFKNQQDVVRNERRQSYENRPFGIVEEAVTHLMYPRDHPYYGDVIGSHADIQAAQLADVKTFFKQYYVPNNASVAIVGDINKAETLKLVEKYFGSFKRGADVPPVKVTTPPITEERRLVVKDRIEMPRVYMAWIVPPIYTDGDAAADITSNLLGGDKVSRLYKSLVYEKQIAQDVSAWNYSYSLGSVFGIQATAAPNHKLEELEKAIDAELETLRTMAPAESELAGAKRTIERSIMFSLEHNGGFGGVADRINAYNHHLKNPDFLQQDVERYRKQTPESIRDFAAKYLTKNSRVVVYGEQGMQDLGAPVPTGELASNEGGESLYPDEPWRAMPPAPGPAPALVLPVPESFQLANGLTVLLNSRKGLPTVAAGLVFRGGVAANPGDKPGLGGFMLDMLDEGTTTRTAMQFSEELKEAGAEISESPARDASSLVLTATRGTVGAAFDLLADAVMNPAFAGQEVERVRKRRLGELVQMKEDPASVSDIVTIIALNGKTNPYAYPVLGTPASVAALTTDDLKNFWKAQITPTNAAMVVAGDFTKDQLLSLLEKSFGKWARTDAPAVNVTTAPSGRRLVIVDTPNAPQSQIRLAIPGPVRSTPDYEPLAVMNEILGGAFSSRVNLNLREQHGYTYGAYSRVRALAHGGWIVAGSGVRTDVTVPAVSELVKEVTRMGETPVTEQEMTLAKSSLVGALPSAFETTSDTVGMLSDIPVYNLGLNYYAEYSKKVEAVGPEKVQEVAKKYLVPDNMLVVAVGDQKSIENGLKALGLGEVELRDADGNVK
jgi:zinc protease